MKYSRTGTDDDSDFASMVRGMATTRAAFISSQSILIAILFCVAGWTPSQNVSCVAVVAGIIIGALLWSTFKGWEN